jgi:hypothetical protein
VFHFQSFIFETGRAVCEKDVSAIAIRAQSLF